ncbi:MAG: helix-turn-helix domain-containing protein [Acidimicrobiales bacterium]
MGAAEIVEDLMELERLAEAEADVRRRRRLLALRDRLAARSEGAKVSEAADVLGVSVPTVRAWTEAGVLDELAGVRPVRISYVSLAPVRGVLDQIRASGGEPHLLGAVARRLRDRAVAADLTEAVGDLEAGRTRVVGEKDLDDLIPPNRRRARSASR